MLFYLASGVVFGLLTAVAMELAHELGPALPRAWRVALPLFFGAMALWAAVLFWRA